jgi:hypothetical protein
MKGILNGFEASVFDKTKQIILDYYSALDSQIDHLSESDRFLKDSIVHLREVFELRVSSIEKRIEKLEKI